MPPIVAGIAMVKGEELQENNHLKFSASIFCKSCGSNIMFLDEAKPDKYYVSVGVINGNPKLPAAHHVFVGSKASWFEINDDLRQHDTYPSAFKNE